MDAIRGDSRDHLSLGAMLRVDVQRKQGAINCGERGAGRLCDGVAPAEIIYAVMVWCGAKRDAVVASPNRDVLNARKLAAVPSGSLRSHFGHYCNTVSAT